MKDVIQSNSGVTHKNSVKANHAGGKHKGVKEGINAPSQQTIVQPKLELTTPGDSYEREADRMADFVMRKAYSGLPTEMPSTSSVLPPMISRRASSSTSGVTVDNTTESGIHASRGGGQPMPTALRSQMESGFEADFSEVRLHTGSAAEAMSNDLRAKAFTYGNDIYFNRGQYSSDTTAGQHLIAHELTHVIQQSGKVGREEKLKTENKNIALIFYGKGGITSIDGKVKHDVGKAYQKSAKSACSIINMEKNNPNSKLAHFPTEILPCKLIYTPTKNDFFLTIKNQPDDSISYIGIYSHGQQDQIILGGFKKVKGKRERVDIDIHIEDIKNNAGLLNKKIKNEAIIDLWGCSEGAGDNSIAQHLANAIGNSVEVYAYDVGTVFQPNVKPTKHKHDYNGITLPNPSNGNRILFTPKIGREDEIDENSERLEKEKKSIQYNYNEWRKRWQYEHDQINSRPQVPTNPQNYYLGENEMMSQIHNSMKEAISLINETQNILNWLENEKQYEFFESLLLKEKDDSSTLYSKHIGDKNYYRDIVFIILKRPGNLTQINNNLKKIRERIVDYNFDNFEFQLSIKNKNGEDTYGKNENNKITWSKIFFNPDNLKDKDRAYAIIHEFAHFFLPNNNEELYINNFEQIAKTIQNTEVPNALKMFSIFNMSEVFNFNSIKENNIDNIIKESGIINSPDFYVLLCYLLGY